MAQLDTVHPECWQRLTCRGHLLPKWPTQCYFRWTWQWLRSSVHPIPQTTQLVFLSLHVTLTASKIAYTTVGLSIVNRSRKSHSPCPEPQVSTRAQTSSPGSRQHSITSLHVVSGVTGTSVTRGSSSPPLSQYTRTIICNEKTTRSQYPGSQWRVLALWSGNQAKEKRKQWSPTANKLAQNIHTDYWGELRKKGVKREINNRKIIALLIRNSEANICILNCDLDHKTYNC